MRTSGPDISTSPTSPHGDRSASAERASRNERTVRKVTAGGLGWGVFSFGLPLVIGMILHTAFNLIDLFMISRLDNATAALAAIGICDMVAAVATILATGISTATVALVSRRVGRVDRTGVRRTTWQSLWLVGALSIFFGLCGLFGSDFIIRVVMQAKGHAADIAVGYLRVLLGGCYSIFFLLQITAILRALGHSKSAASLLIAGNALNIVLNVFLIYGAGPHPPIFQWAQPLAQALNIPRLGVMGAGWATLIGRTIPVLVGGWLLAHRRGGPKFHRVYLRPMWKELRALVRIGWPSSTQFVVRVGAILVFISLINANYTTAADQSTLTAYSICLRLETMALFIGMGWGAAASSFVGMNLGAQQLERAKRSGWLAAGYCLVLMLVLASLYLAFSDPLIGFFDDSPEVLRAGRSYLRIVGPSYAVVGVAVVLSQAMTGAGATLSSLVIDAAVLLGMVVPAAIVVTETLDQPRVMLWSVIAIGNALAAAGYLLWYKKGSFLRKAL